MNFLTCFFCVLLSLASSTTAMGQVRVGGEGSLVYFNDLPGHEPPAMGLGIHAQWYPQRNLSLQLGSNYGSSSYTRHVQSHPETFASTIITKSSDTLFVDYSTDQYDLMVNSRTMGFSLPFEIGYRVLKTRNQKFGVHALAGISALYYKSTHYYHFDAARHTTGEVKDGETTHHLEQTLHLGASLNYNIERWQLYMAGRLVLTQDVLNYMPRTDLSWPSYYKVGAGVHYTLLPGKWQPTRPVKERIESSRLPKYHAVGGYVGLGTDHEVGILMSGIKYYRRSYATFSVIPYFKAGTILGPSDEVGYNLSTGLDANLQLFKYGFLRAGVYGGGAVADNRFQSIFGFTGGPGLSVWRLEGNLEAGMILYDENPYLAIGAGVSYVFSKNTNVQPQ
ncbi:MAG: hypothetical protein WD077_15750 [Bacteroidia bacterium]